MSDNKINWFHDFVGVGYNVTDYYPNVYLLFDGRKKPVNAWNEIIKYWPDDEIKMRFVEDDTNYHFILYCHSRVLLNTSVFPKILKISQYYLEFKEEYKNIAILKLALFKLKNNKHELEIYKYKKKITDVRFLNKSEATEDFIVSRSFEILRNQFDNN